ncbi:hypothetical protein KW807_01060 [Candidatus Parcubacteria bacterium]|nr:hypothetical protein [Candidatus Parcubacteria bacterium]
MKFLVVSLVLVMAAGCATALVERPDGSMITQRVVMVQSGIIIKIQNNCASSISVASIHGPLVEGLAWGKGTQQPIPARFEGSDHYDRRIWVEVRAYTSTGVYIGSITRNESVYGSTRDMHWDIDRLDSPPGARCPGPV